MTALDIISLWPSRADLAADCGLDLSAVHSWVKRRRIAAEHDVALVAAARRRGLALTYEDLARHRAAAPDEAAA